MDDPRLTPVRGDIAAKHLEGKVQAARFVTREQGGVRVTPEGWSLPRRHIGRIDEHETDFVTVAERFLGTPYLWGGKSSLGIDCSGLVQIALNAAGIACPRDSDMQQNEFGRPLDAAGFR